MSDPPSPRINSTSITPLSSPRGDPVPVIPEMEEYEKRNLRMMNLLLPSNRKNKKKEKKTIDPDKLEHVKFQKEVEAGFYTPTEEEINQLVLVPHFENVRFRNFHQFRNSQLNGSQDEKEDKIPAGITEEQYNQIKKKAKQAAKEIYKGNYNSNVALDKRRLFEDKSSDDLLSLANKNKFNMYGESQEYLRKAVVQLSREVEQIDSQNKILVAHLQLLDKAKQMLETTAKCSVEAIQWEKQMIDEYHKEKKSHAKRSARGHHSHRLKHVQNQEKTEDQP